MSCQLRSSKTPPTSPSSGDSAAEAIGRHEHVEIAVGAEISTREHGLCEDGPFERQPCEAAGVERLSHGTEVVMGAGMRLQRRKVRILQGRLRAFADRRRASQREISAGFDTMEACTFDECVGDGIG